jgi:uncharacterized membrane protein YkoI
MLREPFIWHSAWSPYENTMRDLFGVVVAALALWSWAVSPAAADEDHDHERARKALEAGEIRPLKEIVGDVQHRCGGKVIEVELEEASHDGQRVWLYQLRMMMPKGDVWRLDVDAATTAILKVKGRGAEGACQ